MRYYHSILAISVLMLVTLFSPKSPLAAEYFHMEGYITNLVDYQPSYLWYHNVDDWQSDSVTLDLVSVEVEGEIIWMHYYEIMIPVDDPLTASQEGFSPGDWLIFMADGHNLPYDVLCSWLMPIYDEGQEGPEDLVEVGEPGEHRWQDFMADFAISVDDDSKSELPSRSVLAQNFPNPFNPITKISFDLPRGSHVRLDVINVSGQRVAVLVNENLSPGLNSVMWDGSSVASGVYYYRLETENSIETKKMVLIK